MDIGKKLKELSSRMETEKQEFINNPLVNNYILCKNELEALLTQVVDILSD